MARSLLASAAIMPLMQPRERPLVVTKHDVSWQAFEDFLVRRGDALPRVTYLDGVLELMSPTYDHETIRRRFADVLEAYLDHLGIEWEGVGHWTLKQAPNAGLEPDECYILRNISRRTPDLAVEVVWKSGGIDKLEIYRRLGVGEVWFWIDEVVTIWVLRDGGYVRVDESEAAPGIDFSILPEMLALPSQSAVRKALRARYAK